MRNDSIDKAPRECEEEYKAIFENSIDAVLFTSPDGTILAANPAACEMFRMSEEELIQVGRNGIQDLSDPKLKPALDKRAKTGRFRGELNYRRKDGTIFPGEVSSAFFKDKNGVLRTTIIIRDITERKQAEESLKESEKRYHMLFTNMAEGFILVEVIWDKNGKPYDYRYLDVNPGFNLQTGLKGEQLLGKSVLEVFPNPSSIEIEKLSEVALSGKSTRFEIYNQITDKCFEVYMFSPEKGKIAAIFTDITKRKKVEKALHESEIRLKVAEAIDTERRRLYDVLETLPVAITLLTPDHHIAFANRIFREKFGEVNDRCCYDFCFEFNRPCEFCEAYKVLETGKLHRWEATMPDGSILDVYNLPFTDVDGSPMVLEMDIDITDRKKAEEKLRESEEKYRNIVETSNEGIYFVNDKSIITFANETMELSGYTREEIIGRPIWDFISEESLPVAKQNFEKRLQGITDNYELKLVRKDGSFIWGVISAKPFFNKHGKFAGYLAMLTDITDRRKAEEKLKESEEKYRNIVETANEGILTTDNENIITYVNNKVTDTIEYSPEEVVGRPIWSFISEEYRPIVKEHLVNRKQGISESYELKLIRKDGSPIWVFLNAKPLFDMEGKYIGAMSMFTDITKRKEAEEALEKIEIAHKQEIHHRVKNNLQVISSLLDLQAEQFRNRDCIRDSEVLEAFKESRDRVISMALIHKELYKGGGFETLNFSQYIKELSNNLLKNYTVGNTNISLKLDLPENTYFDMDIAVPLGIIVNELVTNSFKYAFPGRNKGLIQIALHREEDGEYSKGINKECSNTFTLLVSDNGVGIPENLDFEDLDTLGLQLVTTLVDQLDGELELKKNNGTMFIIRFTVTERDNQSSTPAPQLV